MERYFRRRLNATWEREPRNIRKKSLARASKRRGAIDRNISILHMKWQIVATKCSVRCLPGVGEVVTLFLRGLQNVMTKPAVSCRITPLAAFAAAVHLLGCAGGQVGEEPALCVEQTTRLVGLEEVLPLGFRAMDVLEAVGGERTTTVTWVDSRRGIITLAVAFDGTARFVERTVGPSASASEDIPPSCGDLVELPAAVAVQTDDGRLNESWNQALQTSAPDSARLLHELDRAALPNELVPEDAPEDVTWWIDVTLHAGAPFGEIAGETTTTAPRDANPDTPLASEGFDIAVIGTPDR